MLSRVSFNEEKRCYN